MTVDCQWIETNLEALSCDSLNGEESRLARGHIDTCSSCRNEVDAVRAIDPLIKKHFQRELAIARQPRVVHGARVFGLGTATAALVAILLFVVLRAPQASPITPGQPQIAPTAAIEPPAPIKSDGIGEIDR